MLERLDYHFYPWGNAYYNTSTCGVPAFSKDAMFCWVRECGTNAASPPADCFSGTKLCQHGEDECAADSLEACAMAVYPNASEFAPFVTCFEGERASKLSAAPRCAAKTGLEWSKIAACVKDAAWSGNLDVQMARATAALGASKIGTPWVLIDGKHVEETTGLLKKVCDALPGVPPAGCL